MAGSSRAKTVAGVVAAAAVVAALWLQVFAMTGLLWWNAPSAARPVARPAAPRLPQLQTGWVDVDAYLRTHPVWVE
jgi:hypothetical protein